MTPMKRKKKNSEKIKTQCIISEYKRVLLCRNIRLVGFSGVSQGHLAAVVYGCDRKKMCGCAQLFRSCHVCIHTRAPCCSRKGVFLCVAHGGAYVNVDLHDGLSVGRCRAIIYNEAQQAQPPTQVHHEEKKF